MLDDGEIERRVRLLRPMERPAIPLARDGADAMAGGRPRRLRHAPGTPRSPSVPEFTTSSFHIVTGLLLPIWTRLPEESCRVYRLQTDAGERVIGRLVSPAWVAQTVDRRNAVDRRRTTPGPRCSTAGPSSNLPDGLELRRAKVMGEHRVELAGFTDGMVDRLKAMGLISEIISWRLRLFVPVGATGPGDPRRADGAPSARSASPIERG